MVWPKVWAMRSVSVRPAATVTCWPRMARIAISKPSTQPGTRMPSVPAKCRPNTALIAWGAASRSSAARMRAITVGSTLRRLSLTSRCTTQRAVSKRHCNQPDTVLGLACRLKVRIVHVFIDFIAMLSIVLICRLCTKASSASTS